MINSQEYLSALDFNYRRTFMYRGEISHAQITLILKRLKKELVTDYNTFKRLYAIVNELLENALLHKANESDEVEVNIVENENCFRIISFNSSVKEDADMLLVNSRNINHLSAEELRNRYRNKLLNDSINDKGTIGVGLEVVRMKSKHKVLISMEELEDQNIIIVDARVDK
jgi:two-component sensor histidine kinase